MTGPATLPAITSHSRNYLSALTSDMRHLSKNSITRRNLFCFSERTIRRWCFPLFSNQRFSLERYTFLPHLCGNYEPPLTVGTGLLLRETAAGVYTNNHRCSGIKIAGYATRQASSACRSKGLSNPGESIS